MATGFTALALAALCLGLLSRLAPLHAASTTSSAATNNYNTYINATAQAALEMAAAPRVSQRSGAACAFPFEHGGETYSACMAWEDGYSWCPDAYGWWGICEELGPVSRARSLLSPGAPTIFSI